jgi:hypothetical protein
MVALMFLGSFLLKKMSVAKAEASPRTSIGKLRKPAVPSVLFHVVESTSNPLTVMAAV